MQISGKSEFERLHAPERATALQQMGYDNRKAACTLLRAMHTHTEGNGFSNGQFGLAAVRLHLLLEGLLESKMIHIVF
jgi:hypothetical protein